MSDLGLQPEVFDTLVTSIFPFGCWLCCYLIKKKKKGKEEQETENTLWGTKRENSKEMRNFRIIMLHIKPNFIVTFRYGTTGKTNLKISVE